MASPFPLFSKYACLKSCCPLPEVNWLVPRKEWAVRWPETCWQQFKGYLNYYCLRLSNHIYVLTVLQKSLISLQ